MHLSSILYVYLRRVEVNECVKIDPYEMRFSGAITAMSLPLTISAQNQIKKKTNAQRQVKYEQHLYAICGRVKHIKYNKRVQIESLCIYWEDHIEHIRIIHMLYISIRSEAYMHIQHTFDIFPIR